MPGAAVGQISLPGLDGSLIPCLTATIPNICIWGMDTCQPNSGWPDQLSAVAKEPQETELGWLTICLGCWQGCDASTKGELSFVPALGHRGCVPLPSQLCQARGQPCATTGREAAAPGTAAGPGHGTAGAGGDARLEMERSPAFPRCQLGRKAPIPGHFSTPFGSSVP